MKEPRKIILPESEMPESWYNIAADIPGGLDAPLNPVTGLPVAPQDLAPLFPMAP
jgi:tryptophan synthase beta chain